MFIHVAKLQAEVEEILVNPFESDSLKLSNPLNKIPVLIDGELTLFDSPLICEYLDEKLITGGEASLFRRNKKNYYQVQLLHVRANGIIDASVSSLLESRRSDAEQSKLWLTKWHELIKRSVETLDVTQIGSPGAPNMGSIALAAALGYLDFRFDHFGWRTWHKKLPDWFAEVQQQTWFSETVPTEVKN